MAGPPDKAKLYEAALNHLARYAATEMALRRVLQRRVERWVRSLSDPQLTNGPEVQLAKRLIPDVISQVKQAGLLDDANFASSRGRRLTVQGKSRREALAHLASKGVAQDVAARAVEESPERELAAACAYLRRRGGGSFGNMPELKVLAAMARAGFSQGVARLALALPRDDAEARIKALQEALR